MDQWLVISLRIVHILTGAAWVGSGLLLMGFVIPQARALGPDEGQTYLNRLLDHRWFSFYISGVEVMAVLTGGFLFWNASNGLQRPWLTSGPGLTFAVGAIAAIAALIIGLPVSKTLSRLYYLDPADREGYDTGHMRLAKLSAVYAVLIVVAVAAMAAAQYMNF